MLKQDQIKVNVKGVEQYSTTRKKDIMKANNIFEVAKEISGIFLREKLSAQEVILILRLLESDATVVLVLSQLSEMEEALSKSQKD